MQAPRIDKWVKKDRRAVSPIIATILLVAITVVLAAVLYILVSGLIGGTSSTTSSMAPAFTGAGSCDGATTYNVSLNPSATATTATFAVKIASPSGALVAVGTQGTAGAVGAGCNPTTATTWYGALWSSSGVLEASFTTGGTSGWTGMPPAAPATLPITITSGMTFEVVAGSGTTNVGTDTIQFYGLGSSSVTGSTTL